MKMAAQFHCETGSLRGALLSREHGRPSSSPNRRRRKSQQRSCRGQRAAGLEAPGSVGGSQGWAGFLGASSLACRAPVCAGWRAAGSPSGLNWSLTGGAQGR